MKTKIFHKTKALWIAVLSLVLSVLCFFGFKAWTVKADADVTLVTGQDMVVNKDKLLPAFNYGGAERLSVSSDAVITGWQDGHFFYQEEVYGVSLEMSVTGNTQFCMALRTTGGGCMWSSYGYYAFIDSTNLWITKTDASTISAWTNGMLLQTASYGANLADGNRHTVVFSAIENESGNVVITFQVDGNEAVTAVDEGTALPIEGTAFKMATVNAPNPTIAVYGGIEYTPVTVDDMLANTNKINAYTPGLYTIEQKDNILAYEDATVDAITLDISVVTTGQIFLTMRATEYNAPWGTGLGYFFMFTNDMAQDAGVYVLKKDNAEAGANWTQIGGGFATNFFDGNRHTVELVTADYGSSATLVAVTVDGVAIASAMDTTPIQPTTDHFMVVSGDGTARVKLWGENGANAPEILSAVALNDVIELTFFATKAHADWYNATSLTITDGTTTFVKKSIGDVETKIVNGKERYVIFVPVAPKAYQKDYTLQVSNANGVAFEKTTSVEKYLNSDELNAMAQNNASLANLVEATKVYCESARAYFAGETVATVETNVDVSAYGITVTGEKLPVGITAVKSNLALESSVELLVYFTFSDGALAKNVTVNGKALTKKSDTVYYASIKSISILDCAVAQEFVITDGTDSVTMQMSVLSYVKQALGSDNANLINVVKALANYNACATAYEA